MSVSTSDGYDAHDEKKGKFMRCLCRCMQFFSMFLLSVPSTARLLWCCLPVLCSVMSCQVLQIDGTNNACVCVCMSDFESFPVIQLHCCYR